MGERKLSGKTSFPNFPPIWYPSGKFPESRVIGAKLPTFPTFLARYFGACSKQSDSIRESSVGKKILNQLGPRITIYKIRHRIVTSKGMFLSPSAPALRSVGSKNARERERWFVLMKATTSINTFLPFPPLLFFDASSISCLTPFSDAIIVWCSSRVRPWSFW